MKKKKYENWSKHIYLSQTVGYPFKQCSHLLKWYAKLSFGSLIYVYWSWAENHPDSYIFFRSQGTDEFACFPVSYNPEDNPLKFAFGLSGKSVTF